jgi:hypothetical protein
MQEANKRLFFAFLGALFSLLVAGGAFSQTENVSQQVTGEPGLDQEALEQAPEISPEMLEDIQALEGPLSQEELDAIKSGTVDAPPVDNGGTEPLILPTGESKSAVTPQALSLPSGEASITGMGESFQPLLTTGAASMSIPIALPPGRAGMQPSLAFSYLSTAGNGIMGIGWIVSLPFIARQTDQGMPRYSDASLSGWSSGSLDRFIYNGGEELVPVATPDETADCQMDVSFQIPYYNLSTGDVEDETVEKFPDEVCGWWYFRTKLEGAFLRFFWNPETDQWVVQDKSGTLMYFGPVPMLDSRRHDWNDLQNRHQPHPCRNDESRRSRHRERGPASATGCSQEQTSAPKASSSRYSILDRVALGMVTVG